MRVCICAVFAVNQSMQGMQQRICCKCGLHCWTDCEPQRLALSFCSAGKGLDEIQPCLTTDWKAWCSLALALLADADGCCLPKAIHFDEFRLPLSLSMMRPFQYGTSIQHCKHDALPATHPQ